MLVKGSFHIASTVQWVRPLGGSPAGLSAATSTSLSRATER